MPLRVTRRVRANVRGRNMMKETILVLACAGLLSGCTTIRSLSVRNLDRDIQGEWQLVQWSYRNMAPGHGELVCRFPSDPVLLIIRNGYIVTIQGTNVVSSAPYYITTAEDLVGGGVSPILHSHPGLYCASHSRSHESFFLEDGRLNLLAWDVEDQHGCQNASDYEYRPAVHHERTYECREPTAAVDAHIRAPAP